MSEKKEYIGCAGLPDDRSGMGCVHIYCGNGKGKTTCGMGLTIRAAGSGKKVLLHQFLKKNGSSERKIIDSIKNITVLPCLDIEKFTFQMSEEELLDLKKKNDENLEKLIFMAKDYDMLVLDEIVYAIDKDLVSEDILLDFLANKPYGLEIVLSGRNPSERLQEKADYISEIVKRKHPFDQGISARKGIEM